VIAVKGPDEFVALNSVPTALGAKTMALDPVTGRVFLVTADVDHIDPPAQKGDLPDAVLKPGSVKLLVLEHPWQSVPNAPSSVRN
jgi:hypothetical protein